MQSLRAFAHFVLEKLEVSFANDFWGPNLFGIAVEDGSWVFIAKGFKKAKGFHEIKGEVVKIDLCIEMKFGNDILVFEF